jgi:SAM-dependent methyltransferase
MTHYILQWLQGVRVRFVREPLGSVLEIGSCIVNGSARSVFGDAKRYVGVDCVAGDGVDTVADSHDLELPEQFDVVLCCEMLEHDRDPLATIATCRRHLAPAGLLIVTTPGNGFPEHRFPRDYWRLMPDAMEDIAFDGMEVLCLETIVGPTVCGVGRISVAQQLAQ